LVGGVSGELGGVDGLLGSDGVSEGVVVGGVSEGLMVIGDVSRGLVGVVLGGVGDDGGVDVRGSPL
jgi:hypothetical protein